MNWKKNPDHKMQWFASLILSASELVYQTWQVLLSVRAFLQWKHLASDTPFIFKLADTEQLTSAGGLDHQGPAREYRAATQSCSGPTARLYRHVDVTSERSDAHLKEK